MPLWTEITVSIPNRLAEIEPLLGQIREFLTDGLVPDKIIFSVSLAIDELISNITMYGVQDDGPHDIAVAVRNCGGVISVTIEDDGQEFDPFAPGRAPVETTLPIEDREIGGLGIHIVRELMDRVAYERIGGRNRVTLECNGRPDNPAGPA